MSLINPSSYLLKWVCPTAVRPKRCILIWYLKSKMWWFQKTYPERSYMLAKDKSLNSMQNWGMWYSLQNKQTKLLVTSEAMKNDQDAEDWLKSFDCVSQYFMHQCSSGFTAIPQQCPLCPMPIQVIYHSWGTFKPKNSVWKADGFTTANLLENRNLG